MRRSEADRGICFRVDCRELARHDCLSFKQTQRLWGRRVFFILCLFFFGLCCLGGVVSGPVCRNPPFLTPPPPARRNPAQTRGARVRGSPSAPLPKKKKKNPGPPGPPGHPQTPLEEPSAGLGIFFCVLLVSGFFFLFVFFFFRGVQFLSFLGFRRSRETRLCLRVL